MRGIVDEATRLAGLNQWGKGGQVGGVDEGKEVEGCGYGGAAPPLSRPFRPPTRPPPPPPADPCPPPPGRSFNGVDAAHVRGALSHIQGLRLEIID